MTHVFSGTGGHPHRSSGNGPCLAFLSPSFRLAVMQSSDAFSNETDRCGTIAYPVCLRQNVAPLESRQYDIIP